MLTLYLDIIIKVHARTNLVILEQRLSASRTMHCLVQSSSRPPVETWGRRVQVEFGGRHSGTDLTWKKNEAAVDVFED
jgi:hypothetical protein